MQKGIFKLKTGRQNKEKRLISCKIGLNYFCLSYEYICKKKEKKQKY